MRKELRREEKRLRKDSELKDGDSKRSKEVGVRAKGELQDGETAGRTRTQQNTAPSETLNYDNQAYETPMELIRCLERDVLSGQRFTLDAAARSDNTKAPTFCNDGLKDRWTGRVCSSILRSSKLQRGWNVGWN